MELGFESSRLKEIYDLKCSFIQLGVRTNERMDGTAAPLSDVFFNRQVENVDARGTDDSERERERGREFVRGASKGERRRESYFTKFWLPKLTECFGLNWIKVYEESLG